MRTPTNTDEAARALEATLLRQLLQASGAFKGSDAAGAQIHADMFVEAMADAVAAQDGLGLAKTLEDSLPPEDDAPAAPPAPPPRAAQPAGEASIAPGVRETGAFGLRTDPIDGTEKFHTGVDLAAPEGTPVVAVQGGVVTRAGPRGGYGNAVEIDHGGGLTTLYGHASALAVHAGDVVREGETIAAVGHTGRATGPHLHFEVRRNGVPENPDSARAIRALNAYGGRAESPLGNGETPRP
jgi:murein DD-endopeptidase MepM/ murein hydrolase activator NlpD